MTRWRAPMTKFSHTSSKQPHKPVSHGVLEAYNFFGKTQNRMVNHQHTRNRKSFEKSWVFLSPSIVSFSRISILSFLSLILQDSGFFLCFPLKFCEEIGAREVNPLEHARPFMDLCVTLYLPLIWNLSKLDRFSQHVSLKAMHQICVL